MIIYHKYLSIPHTYTAERKSHAKGDIDMYLDPGFGSMLIQIIIAGFAGCSVVLYSMRGKLRSFFKKDSIEDKETESEAPQHLLSENDLDE